MIISFGMTSFEHLLLSVGTCIPQCEVREQLVVDSLLPSYWFLKLNSAQAVWLGVKHHNRLNHLVGLSSTVPFFET